MKPESTLGAAHPARSVCSAVELALWTARLSTVASGLVPAAAAAFLLAALVELDGASAHPGAPSIVVLSAVLAVLSYWLERWPDDRDVVRDLDAGQRLRGTLVTFWEHRRLALGGERFPSFLAERLQPAARGAVLARACLPKRPGWIALPCAAAALWIWTLERAPNEVVLRRTAMGGLEAAARSLAECAAARASAPGTSERAPEASAGTAVELPESPEAPDATGDPSGAARVRALAAQALLLASDAQRPRTQADHRLEELALSLARIAEGSIAPELRPPIDRLRGALDALRDALPGAAGRAGLPAGGARPAAVPPPDRAGAGASDPSPALPSDGAWWDTRYDALVSGWIESRRRAP